MDEILTQFTAWLEEARAQPQIIEPTAMSLATIRDHIPSNRIVLLKAYDRDGFVFFTNLQSRKSMDLSVNPHAALCFYWGPIGKQVRIIGKAEPVGEATADAYFATRPRDSQLGTWASDQSRPLESRAVFMQKMEQIRQRFEGGEVPRPPHWSGWRIRPTEVEFWKEGHFRLHERDIYTLQPNGNWLKQQLYP